MFGNTFGTTSKTYGGSKNIWHEIKGSYPIGGTVDLTDYGIGDVIPAGSMCYLDMSDHTVEIKHYTAPEGTDEPVYPTVNGLLKNDIYVDAAAKSSTGAATATVVFAGEIYADRLAEEIPDAVFATLPMIVPIREASSN